MPVTRSLRSMLMPAVTAVAASVQAQEHVHHHMDMPDTTARSMPAMTHAYSLSAPMNRNGSGTAWLPDASPMFGYMAHAGGWMLMMHGNLFLRYTAVNVNGPDARGDDGLDAPNWLMGMAQRRVGANGLLAFTLMGSMDPVTIGGAGYPLLFQSGETWNGEPLVDRQHPHDLLSALSVGYTHRIGADVEVTGYFGYPGEPALGPVAFMHRVSALSDPDAPLGHHWQDATHITFGVATAGVRYRFLRLEASLFNGREPDEDRYGWDVARFDSRSVRLSAVPSVHWALQASTAAIASPEGPGTDDVQRTTASVSYASRPEGTSWNGTVAWGLNDAGHGHREHSVLLEAARVVERANTYLRYEWVQKSADELRLDALPHGAVLDVHSLTLGHAQRLLRLWGTELFLGAQATAALPDDRLVPFYGSTPLSVEAYLRLTPARMAMR